MEKMEYRGLVVRIRKCAYDLVLLEEDLVDDDDDCDDEWWELMERELRLKSTFLYCDLNKVISSADDEHKKPFTSLANRLFYYMEEVSFAYLHFFMIYIFFLAKVQKPFEVSCFPETPMKLLMLYKPPRDLKFRENPNRST